MKSVWPDGERERARKKASQRKCFREKSTQRAKEEVYERETDRVKALDSERTRREKKMEKSWQRAR